MSTELTVDDKIFIVSSKIRFLNEQLYNYEVDLQLENAKNPIEQETIQNILDNISNINTQKPILDSLLESLENTTK